MYLFQKVLISSWCCRCQWLHSCASVYINVKLYRIMEKETYMVIGLMSGTSLDGIDVAFCHFRFDGSWSWEIIQAETIAYPQQLHDSLKSSMELSGLDLALLDKDLGVWMGKTVSEFICSHGVEN